ncbi:hypothetical protein [Pseudomonas asiatica]|uniref:hypothetical protein n=1 Tax=Pseudomonas asiatica TaxID=2219225 RepID=UPI002015FB48|nr:hypothetical protein [Pseudomonas asiatica]
MLSVSRRPQTPYHDQMEALEAGHRPARKAGYEKRASSLMPRTGGRRINLMRPDTEAWALEERRSAGRPTIEPGWRHCPVRLPGPAPDRLCIACMADMRSDFRMAENNSFGNAHATHRHTMVKRLIPSKFAALSSNTGLGTTHALHLVAECNRLFLYSLNEESANGSIKKTNTSRKI